MESRYTVIAVVGHPASGKDTVADYIAEKGFAKISSSDIIRTEMNILGISTERSNMVIFAKETRVIYGNSYPTGGIIKQINGDTVISGFRNLDEIGNMRATYGERFYLVAVEAPIETRYGWGKERGRFGDNISFEQFRLDENTEKADRSGSHEVDQVIKTADILLINDGTKEDLYKKADTWFATIQNDQTSVK